ncbi:MFS general substrate transporter, partial [Meira miltonrushii]
MQQSDQFDTVKGDDVEARAGSNEKQHQSDGLDTTDGLDATATNNSERQSKDATEQKDTTPPAPNPLMSPSAFPEGGKDAWLCVLGGCLAFTAGVGFINSFSVFQAYYRSKTLPGHSDDDIAWIGSIQLWGAFFFGLPAGKMSDKFGPKIPLAIGTFFIVFGTMMASISKSYYQFILSQGLCSCIGYGLCFTPALSVPSTWFLKKRGLAIGLVVSGTSVGGVIWPIAINRMLNFDGVSLGWTLRMVGFLQLALMVAATFLIKSRLPRNLLKDPPPITKFLTDRTTMIFVSGGIVMFFGLYVPYFYITPYGIRWGASPGAAFYYPAIMNGVSFFGRFIIGILADRKLGFF